MAPATLDPALCDCVNHPDPDLWFPTNRTDADTARAICAHCPSAGACLVLAQQFRHDHGIWGGTTPDQRRRLIATQRPAAASQEAIA